MKNFRRAVFLLFLLAASGVAGQWDYEDELEPEGPCTWSSTIKE